MKQGDIAKTLSGALLGIFAGYAIASLKEGYNALAIIVIMVSLYITLFTGDITEVKLKGMIRYTYVFTVLALIGSIVPFMYISAEDVAPDSPVGLMHGCVERSNKDSFPDEVLCDRKVESENSPNGIGNNRLWFVNIGGSTIYDESETKSLNEPDKSGSSVKSTKKLSLHKVSGGIVVPLYVIVLSLMGAAISMTRRVPEYQRSYFPQVTGTGGKSRTNDGTISAKRIKDYARLRELLVFQIMQVLSAPMIATVGYYLVAPGTKMASVVIAFVSGFASGVILVAVRATADLIRDKISTT